MEGESDKLLNSHLGKNGRPLVTTSMTDPPTSSSKLNGGSGGDSSRQTGNNNGDDRRSTSDSNKDSPNGGMRFMLPSQAGMPQLPMPFLPGMFPNLLGMCCVIPKEKKLNDNFTNFFNNYLKIIFQVLETDNIDENLKMIMNAKDLQVPDLEIKGKK